MTALNSICRVCLIAALLTSAEFARAQDWAGCSVIYVDRSDRFKLGEYAIGTKAVDILSKAELRSCIEHTTRNSDCWFDDTQRISYHIVGTEPLERVTVLSAATPPNGQFTGNLIAGVAIGDTLFEASKKLGSLPYDFPPWVLSNFGSMILSTSFCLRSSSGALWRYELEFGEDGRLIGAAADDRKSLPEP